MTDQIEARLISRRDVALGTRIVAAVELDLELKLRALAIWQARELKFSARDRRMTPDAKDLEGLGWARCVTIAKQELTKPQRTKG